MASADLSKFVYGNTAGFGVDSSQLEIVSTGGEGIVFCWPPVIMGSKDLSLEALQNLPYSATASSRRSWVLEPDELSSRTAAADRVRWPVGCCSNGGLRRSTLSRSTDAADKRSLLQHRHPLHTPGRPLGHLDVPSSDGARGRESGVSQTRCCRTPRPWRESAAGPAISTATSISSQNSWRPVRAAANANTPLKTLQRVHPADREMLWPRAKKP